MKIIVTGIPRSGTTWVGAALAGCKEAVFVDEPDDERRYHAAAHAKFNLGRYPIIAPGDVGTVGGYPIGDYHDLWVRTWSVAHSFKHVIVKTCLTPFCFEWLLEFFKPDHVVWVDRYPLNTLASWVEYAKKKHPDEPIEKAIHRMVWQYGMLYTTYSRLRKSGWIKHHMFHEDLSSDFKNFEFLASFMGLEWTQRSYEWLEDMNKQGEGGHIGLEEYSREDHINREAREQTRNRWEWRLSTEEIHQIRNELMPWPDVISAL